MKSWNLNFLEPTGPLQACNGTALPFTECNSNVLLTVFRTLGCPFLVRVMYVLMKSLRILRRGSEDVRESDVGEDGE
jgi:hypothetical protein